VGASPGECRQRQLRHPHRRRRGARHLPAAARLLRLPVAQVLPASTGVIGVELDSKLIVNALPRLVAGLREDAFGSVARAIMTTDLVPKEAFAVR
jgi:N-acetylglutamate synthase/N-acetylornithine aminotransferase